MAKQKKRGKQQKSCEKQTLSKRDKILFATAILNLIKIVIDLIKDILD